MYAKGDITLIDIHCHIVPHLDDGASDNTMAMNMIKIAQDTGIDTIIATPHYIKGEMECTRQQIIESVKKLNDDIKTFGFKITILPGQEIFLIPEILDNMESVMTLGDGGIFMLLELPLSHMPIYTQDVLYKLRLNGIIPVIAHPERNSIISRDLNAARRLIDNGVLLQVNSSSLRGVFGRTAEKTARTLLKEGLVHFIATDAHTDGTRRPLLLVSDIPTDELLTLTEVNPKKLLNGDKKIEPVKIHFYEKRRVNGLKRMIKKIFT